MAGVESLMYVEDDPQAVSSSAADSTVDCRQQGTPIPADVKDSPAESTLGFSLGFPLVLIRRVASSDGLSCLTAPARLIALVIPDSGPAGGSSPGFELMPTADAELGYARVPLTLGESVGRVDPPLALASGCERATWASPPDSDLTFMTVCGWLAPH
jgi:hypothetical protein